MKIPQGDLIVRASILQKSSDESHPKTASNTKSVVIPLISEKNEAFTLDHFVGQLSEVYSHLIPSDSSEEKPTFQLKWRDEDQDLVTIGSDAELYEALRTCEKEGKNWVLQIFLIVGHENEESKTSEKELAGVIKVFSKMHIDPSDPNSNAMVIDSEEKNKEKSLMLSGSEWNGYCFYSDTNEIFRFKLRVGEKVATKDQKEGQRRDEISGVIEWAEPLNAKTKFMGLLINEETFKFREYEIMSGEDQVTVPTDYIGKVDPNSNLISGNIKTKKGEPAVTFELEFAGFNSKRDGFLAVSGSKPMITKRKYNLVINDSGKPPTVEDRQRAFKVLTQGTTYWYDRSKKGELELRPKNDTEIRGRTKSCPTCNNPMFEQYDINGRKILACSSYPNCKRRRCECYDYDDCDCHHHWC